MPTAIMRSVTENSGASAVEYALVASLISVLIIAASTLAGGYASDLFNAIGNTLKNVAANV